MVRRMRLTPQSVKPPPDDPDGPNGGQRPARKQLPDKDEIRGWINELHSGLAADDNATVEAAERLCRALSLRAAERLGLVVTGIQPGTVPQVVMSSITLLKGAGVVGKDEAGVAAEATE
jgi:hypothetical protein